MCKSCGIVHKSRFLFPLNYSYQLHIILYLLQDWSRRLTSLDLNYDLWCTLLVERRTLITQLSLIILPSFHASSSCLQCNRAEILNREFITCSHFMPCFHKMASVIVVSALVTKCLCRYGTNSGEILCEYWSREAEKISLSCRGSDV